MCQLQGSVATAQVGAAAAVDASLGRVAPGAGRVRRPRAEHAAGLPGDEHPLAARPRQPRGVRAGALPHGLEPEAGTPRANCITRESVTRDTFFGARRGA